MSTLAVPMSSRAQALPPLENGDRLTRAEFERRFNAMGDLKKAELIEGMVYMAPPVSHEYHGLPHANLGFWLTLYRASTAGVSGGDNSTLRLDLDNEPQPDLYLMVAPDRGG